MPQKEQQIKTRMAALLVLAFGVRVLLAAATKGYTYDVNCFFAWALKMADQGAAAFYSEGYFADYPPGYMLVLGFVGRVVRAFHLSYTGKAARVVLTLVPTLCDCALAWIIFRAGQRAGHSRAALRIGGFAAFCPVLLFDTAVWKQVDGVFALAIVACFVLLNEDKYIPAALCYGAALAIKPQALLVGPVLAVCFLRPMLAKESGPRSRAVGQGAAGVAAALLPPVLCGLPFWGGGVVGSLLEKYTATSQSYPYASINAFGGMAMLGGNWVEQSTRFGPLTYQQWGTLNLALLSAALVFLALRSHAAKRFSPLLLAAFYAVGVFTVSHRMHERYLIFGALLVLAAAARYGEKRLLALGCGFSLTSLFNLAAVYCQVDTDDEWLSSATSQTFIRLCSTAQVILFALLVYVVIDLLLRGRAVALTLPEEPERPTAPAPQPVWEYKEKLFLFGLTAVVAVISLWNLGDTKAPQNGLDTVGGDDVSATAAVPDGALLPETVWVYPGVNTGGTVVITAADSGARYELTLDYGNVFHWQTVAVEHSSAYTVTVENARVMEISFRDGSGAAVEMIAPESPLFDEAALVPEEISYKNSTYFDEIYHARTGYEMLHGMTVYETTHPPLGKDFIMLGIAIFGMTGFGWRISGTLFGILMVPVLYLFLRRLTHRPTLAALGGILLGLDFMRFAQSRIATIDVYATFFILLAAYFMVWYAQSVLTDGVHHSLLPMGLAGLAFGLGCASKWTGLYAGAGLAVVYFGVLWLRYRQKPANFAGEAALVLVGGAVFFVAVPVAIYLASYLPYYAKDPSFSLTDWWNCQTYMYWYHSTLKASHPFESRWYTWLLDLRPVWYYQNTGLPAGRYASIAGYGSPVVWPAAAAGIVALGVGRLCGRGDHRWTAVLVLFAAQLLPWVLVSRCTFMYHAFPSLVFALTALILCMEALLHRSPDGARRAGQILCLLAAVTFVLWYPSISGMEVSAVWAAAMKMLPGWGFYII